MIRLISIKNFRSIQSLSAATEEITTFVGPNDAGKSNILRALNLFFNNETDHKTEFNFKSDFNANAKIYKQRAKEITIELVLKLPRSYRRNGYPDTVYWKKVWRESGKHKESEEIKYCEIRSERLTKKADLPPRSKIKSLLENINFIYIPAIKDKYFFIDLQGKIYEVLAQTAESELHRSAKNFESKIKDEFTGLLKSIDSTFKNNNTISLPQNLRGIFETLEFNSNNIPLARRGDGIKIRHIPSMLRFIGDKSGSRHNTLITPQIWGFEEPENNVELSSCFDLNKQFVDAAKNNFQIILTTHSPAIYNIDKEISTTLNLKSARFYISKCTTTNETHLKAIDDNSLHQEMGFMPLIAPIIAEKEMEWIKNKEQQEKTIQALESALKADKKHRLFVEGKSDKAIFEKVIKIYFPELIETVCFDLSDNSSANSATDKAKAFHLIQKHNKEENRLKSALILDNDSEGRKCKKDIETLIENKNKNVKVFLITKLPHIHNLISKGFNVASDLESCLPEYIWKYSLRNEWLEEKTLSERFTQATLTNLVNSKKNLDDHINEQSDYDKLLINYSLTTKGKEKLSKYISSESEDTLKNNNTLENLRDFFKPIRDFLIN